MLRPMPIFRIVVTLTLLLTMPTPAQAGRQVLIDEPVRISGFGFLSTRFEIPGTWMKNPRLQGQLTVSGGGGNDIDVLLLHASDLAKWEKRQEITPLESYRRATTVDLDVPLPDLGRYVIVLSNRFSKFSAKTVTGSLAVVWDDAPTTAAVDSLRSRIAFLDLPANRTRIEVPVGEGTPPSLVTFERFSSGAEAPYAIAIQRHVGDQLVVETIERHAGKLDEIGTIALHEGQDRDVFVVATMPGRAMRRDLMIVCPSLGGVASISITGQPGTDSTATRVDVGQVSGPESLSLEKAFLEGVSSAYNPPATSSRER